MTAISAGLSYTGINLGRQSEYRAKKIYEALSISGERFFIAGNWGDAYNEMGGIPKEKGSKSSSRKQIPRPPYRY